MAQDHPGVIASSHGLLRAHGHGHARVTNIELFFDLVFVFAVTQLSHTLLHHPDGITAARVGLLFLATWWAWIYTAWATNWLDPERAPVRLMLFAVMLGGLVLAAALPRAFEGGGVAVALAYVAIQAGRTAFGILGFPAHDARGRRNFQRILAWFGLAAPFWIAGAFAPPAWRLALWALAVGIEYAGPAFAFRTPGLGRSEVTDWNIEGGHLAERCSLFVIIALGESLLVTGATFAETPWTGAAAAAFVSAFLGSVAMWWIYFDSGAERATRHITRTDLPGRMARLGYTYLHMPIVAGIILSAVADEMVLAHPGGHASAMAAVAILGGPALYVLGNALFKRITLGHLPLSHLVGLGLLAAATFLVPVLSPLALSTAATLALIVVAGWERVSLGAPA